MLRNWSSLPRSNCHWGWLLTVSCAIGHWNVGGVGCGDVRGRLDTRVACVSGCWSGLLVLAFVGSPARSSDFLVLLFDIVSGSSIHDLGLDLLVLRSRSVIRVTSEIDIGFLVGVGVVA